MKRDITEKEALRRLEDLCSRSEHCTFELDQKMERWGLDRSTKEKIIDRLIETRFVDDERFANAYTREKYIFSKWGQRKITSGLYAKRIPKWIIEKALDAINKREYATIAFRVVASKLHTLPKDMPEFEKRQRLIRHALSRGYETSLVMKIINSHRLWDSKNQ